MAISAKDIVTPNVMREIQGEVNEARKDTTPHAALAGDNVMVIGDANKIELQKHDYKVVVVWPRTMAEKYGIPKEDIIKENATHVAFEMEFKDVQILPINRFKVTSAVADILPFFSHYDEDGSVKDFSSKELVQLSLEMSEQILDSLYLFVGAVLNVKKEVYQYFDYTSVLELTTQFFNDFPDVINEADF